jgi:DNA-binding transcriptional ArsR family regulator
MRYKNMRQEPAIATIAALIGDTGRAAMLTALADGRALPAGELAAAAGLSAPAASGHLAKLLDGGLLAVESEGRHRYYRLAGPGVAAILESLSAMAGQPAQRAVTRTPEDHALRHARSCYDHLAGEIGVAVADALETRGLLVATGGKRLDVTPEGKKWFSSSLAIEVSTLRPGRNGVACRCLDWTERRHHLAGPLGTNMFQRFCDRDWVQRRPGSRAVWITPTGRDGLRETLGIELATLA